MAHESQNDRRRQPPKAGPSLMREKLGFGGICQGLIGTGCPHVKEDVLIGCKISDQSL
jgi:hypothetical protein